MSSTLTKKAAPARIHWILLAVVGFVAFLIFVHPDIVETANHSYLLLDSIFSGRFLYFYEDVMLHESSLYYINFAHYNILVYLIFGIVELPVYAVCSIFGLAVNETLLVYIGKLVSAGFFAACIPLVAAIGSEIGLKRADRRWAALFFALWPPAFFSVLVMGQYDSICLFFTLMGILRWMQGDKLRFSFWMGLGAACKFFPLLLFAPLLLLIEKRPLHILKYAFISLWLVAPTALLFYGRDGDMGFFNNLMVRRLFAAVLPGDIPLFPVAAGLICVLAWFWHPTGENRGRTGLRFCLAMYGVLFLFVEWHPQWLLLLAPFVVLTTFMEQRRTLWAPVDLILSAGVFIYCFVFLGNQLESNLLDFGIVGVLTGLNTAVTPHNAVLFYLELLPFVVALPLALFACGLLCHLLLKLPAHKGTSLAGRLAANGQLDENRWLPACLWATFGGAMAIWLVPTVFTWLKCFGLL